MSEGERKEKYFSLSHQRLDGNPICGYNDTHFLCVDSQAEADPEPDFVEPESSDSFRSASMLRKSSSIRFENPSPTIPIEDETIYDNFLGTEPHFHRITLYETKLRFYLVASLKEGSIFKILKIDRDAQEDSLSIDTDPMEYSAAELNQLLNTINEGNKNAGGLSRVATADGIIGFIRFTQGYYLVLITEKVKRGSIGPHQVYSVGKTGYVYIPRSRKKVHSSQTAQENRYKTLFFNMNFTDFYYSYTYDLTHTLQHNLTYTGKPFYNKRFAWNHFLMKPLLENEKDTSRWAHPLIHGYFAQNTLSQHGRHFRMSIIARRSRYFAGTRYLKRGVNSQGRVANDVETEQIAEDCNWGNLRTDDKFTAFVQIRGSIPLFWGQEPRTLTPKPPIFLQRCDPLYLATKLHFRDLFRRFGYPIVVLNLVKEKEKKPRESVLRTELAIAIKEINDTLPEKYKIEYIAWDFSRAAKSEEGNVITQMTTIAERSLSFTGFFHSGKRLYGNQIIKDHLLNPIASENYDENGKGKVQRGVLRSNCIDSLDRTNAAQFVVGKVAMGYQLYALGITPSPEIDFDDKIGEVLMYLYQDMGNNLAMQYGGSELAHTMKSYKGTESGGLGNKPRDMFTSFRRYYSNSFMDNEKQDKINLFLGNYKPWQETTDLWDLETDYYLHMKDPSYSDKMLLYEKWWESSVSQFHDKKVVTRAVNLLDIDDDKYGLCMEAYDISRLSSFDKKIQRDAVVMLEQYPAVSSIEQAYYGRHKQWLTIRPSDNTRSESDTRIEPNWDPTTDPHPDFELAKLQIQIQQSVSGPKHNLLSYYSISLNVSSKSITLYSNYVDFKNVATPKQILSTEKGRDRTKAAVLSYTPFNIDEQEDAPTKPTLLSSHSMMTLVQTTPSPPAVVRRRFLGASMASTPPPRSSLPNTAAPSNELSAQTIRANMKQRNRTSKLYQRENEEMTRQAFKELLDKQADISIVSATNELYSNKFKEYQSRRKVLTLNVTSPSHISNRSLMAYTKACAQQC